MKNSTKRELRTHLVVALAVSATVLFANLGGAKLWDRDEPRNAGCAAEMLQRGDLITPIFNDELRGAKPVLTYWLMMTAYQVFGVNEFGARFWSALLGCGTVLLTYFNGRRMFNPTVGLLAAVVLSTSLMFVVAGRAATPDSVLIFFVTLAMSIYIRNAFPREGLPKLIAGENRSYFPQRFSEVLVMYAAMGMAVLAKGPVGLILPTAIIGMFLLIKRLPTVAVTDIQSHSGWRTTLPAMLQPFRPRHFLKTCWSMRPLTAIVVVLLVAAPWYVAVGIQTNGDFLRAFFVNEHFGRATTAMENHNGNLFFYPLTMMAGLFPWSVFTLPLILMLRKQMSRESQPQSDNWSDGYLLAICWITVWIAAFTIARTKLPSYATPCYPAAALLIGAFLYRWSTQHADVPAIISRLSFGTLAVVGLVITIAIPIAVSHFFRGEEWLAIVGLIPLCGGIAAVIAASWLKRNQAVVVFAATAVLFSLALFAVAAGVISRHRSDTSALAEITRSPDTKPSAVGACGCMESSWVFYAEAPVHELVQSDREVSERDRLYDWQPKPKLNVDRFFAQYRDGLLLTRHTNLDAVLESCSCNLKIVTEADYFLENEKLIVLRIAEETTKTTVAEADSDGTVR